MEDTVCTKYFNLLYLSKTICVVLFNLHFVEGRHRYNMVLCFMNAGSYNTNTNYILPELVNIIDLFDNAVGNRDNENPDDKVFLENIIDVLQTKKQSWWVIW